METINSIPPAIAAKHTIAAVPDTPHHYSEGVQSIAWPETRIAALAASHPALAQIVFEPVSEPFVDLEKIERCELERRLRRWLALSTECLLELTTKELSEVQRHLP